MQTLMGINVIGWKLVYDQHALNHLAAAHNTVKSWAAGMK